MFTNFFNSTQPAIIAGIFSIIYGIFLTKKILKHPRGNDKMNQISDAISEGANAYMKRQYMVVSIIGLIFFVILYFIFGKFTAIGFAIGAIFSAIAGVVGMSIAVKSNIRTAQAAKDGLGNYFQFYNTERPHQSLGDATPSEVYYIEQLNTNTKAGYTIH